MSSCSEPMCRNKDNVQMIACASPFCGKKFHLSCAGLKAKQKELSKLYFVCRTCEEFIQYSNSKLDQKLNEIEAELNNNIVAVKSNIAKLEESTSNLKHRLDAIENSLKETSDKQELKDISYNSTTNKIVEMEKGILDLKNEINLLKETISTDKTNKNADSDNVPQPPANHTYKSPTLKYQLRISGVMEQEENLKHFERQKLDFQYAEKMLKHIGKENCKLSDCFRLGKFKKDQKKPRWLVITFISVWDRNMVLQSSSALSTFEDRIFLSPVLSPADMELEKKILKKRRELINDGANKKELKIKNLKLYYAGECINTD